VGSLIAGGLVTLAGPTEGGGGAFSGYGIAALAGALAAIGYLIAVAVLVDEGDRPARASERPAPVRQQVAEIFATARTELMESVAVRVVVITGIALGMSFTAVELLWQPHLADLLSDPDTHGVTFGALAAGSMFAAAAGAAVSPRLKRGVGLRSGYVFTLVLGAVCVALLGAPDSVAMFIPIYLVAYLSMGLADPLHFELLNDAVGATARATLISAEALATQGGALVANLAVGALASSQGTAFVWALAGTLLAITTLAVAVPLYRTARTARA